MDKYDPISYKQPLVIAEKPNVWVSLNESVVVGGHRFSLSHPDTFIKTANSTEKEFMQLAKIEITREIDEVKASYTIGDFIEGINLEYRLCQVSPKLVLFWGVEAENVCAILLETLSFKKLFKCHIDWGYLYLIVPSNQPISVIESNHGYFFVYAWGIAKFTEDAELVFHVADDLNMSGAHCNDFSYSFLHYFVWVNSNTKTAFVVDSDTGETQKLSNLLGLLWHV